MCQTVEVIVKLKCNHEEDGIMVVKCPNKKANGDSAPCSKKMKASTKGKAPMYTHDGSRSCAKCGERDNQFGELERLGLC